MNIKVSVLIPVYGVEKYLREFLDKLCLQKIKEVEYIIVNDASPDSCGEIIQEFVEKDSRFIYIDKPINEGLYAARQDAFDASSGEYVINLDPDDLISENFILNMYNLATKHDLDIVVSNVDLITENGNSISNSKSVSYTQDFIYNKSNISKLISTPYATWCRLYRKRLLEKNNYKYVKGELHLTNYHFLEGVTSGFSSSSKYFYRIRDNSMSSARNSSKKLKNKLSVESIQEFKKDLHLLNVRDDYLIDFNLFNHLSFTKLSFISSVYNNDFNRYKKLKSTVSDEFPCSALYKLRQAGSIPNELLLFSIFELLGLSRFILHFKSKK